MIRVKYIFCFFLTLPFFINAQEENQINDATQDRDCLLYTSPSPRDVEESRMPSSA